MISEQNLVWLDLEMTGLNPDLHHILQIAVIVTDKNLEVCAEGPELVVHQSAENLLTMDSWVRDIHTHSGLLNKVAASSLSEKDAEQEILAFLERYCIPKTTILCGNSIWVDRTFLKKHMPQLDSFFYYRMIDVSTLKELIARFYPQDKKYEKNKRHTALSDIRESIAELQYYREYYLKKV